MSSGTITSPLVEWDFGTALYPERPEDHDDGFDRFGGALEGRIRRWIRARPPMGFAEAVNAAEAPFLAMSDDELKQDAALLRCDLKADGAASHLVRCFALLRECSRRSIGIRHYNVQIVGALTLVRGKIAEMETGEGKTFTAALAAAAAALTREPTHVITVNDYLAKRDLETSKPLFDFVGLSAACVLQGMTPDERRRAYRADITYGSNKEIAFDFLRDRLARGMAGDGGDAGLRVKRLDSAGGTGLVMRGLRFAIVDEADSVLVDEARTPLILSGRPQNHVFTEMVPDALTAARDLVSGEDYELDVKARAVTLTPQGRAGLADLAERLGGPWKKAILREEAVRSALAALYLFKKGDQYVVRDGRIQIVDEYTGRIAEDRQWSAGQHQLIEAKEGCALSEQRVTLAQTTYQRFFRRYRRLSGMTGTAREVSAELWSVYRLPVVSIPTHRPSRRVPEKPRVFKTLQEKHDFVADLTEDLSRRGVPVLIGTRTVSASEALSETLAARGLPHQVLNATQDGEEAALVARAGEPGRLTVATNMAGRGTDIKLPPEALDAGGLFVVVTERHDAGRIDRQLIGRCGRQGDPGRTIVVTSMEDDLLEPLRRSAIGRLMIGCAGLAGSFALPALFTFAQRQHEGAHARMRAELLRRDRKLGTVMAFAGKQE